jgi:hypothetical protein
MRTGAAAGQRAAWAGYPAVHFCPEPGGATNLSLGFRLVSGSVGIAPRTGRVYPPPVALTLDEEDIQ